MTTVSAPELAHILNLETRTIQLLAKKKVVKKKSRGEYILEDSVRGYIGSLRAQIDNGGDQGDDRMRLVRARADKEEFTLAILRKEYLPQKEIFKVFGDMIIFTKTKLRSLKKKIAPTVTVCTDIVENEKYIGGMVDDALSGLSKPRKDQFAASSLESDKPVVTPTKSKSKRVGKKKRTTNKRAGGSSK